MELTWLFLTGSIFAILSCLLLILLINLFTFHRLKPLSLISLKTIGMMDGRVDDLPLVSVLVPARNEELGIEPCVRSLLAQTYPNLEILVLDDQSDDRTPQIVQRLIAELPPGQQGRLRLLAGAPLPSGWIGKNFACHQLAQQARGSYLLFTDADTFHQPALVTAVIERMKRENVQLLTALPEQIMLSPGERLIVPLVTFTMLSLLPVPLVRLRPEPSLSTGVGQLLCFERKSYETSGGHAAVKGLILEDVLLARTLKAAGFHMTFVDAFDLVQCRMYRSFTEVWNGFSKNLFAFYNYTLPVAFIAILLTTLLYIVPVMIVLAALFIKLPAVIVGLSLSSYLLATLMHILLTLRFVRTGKLTMLLLTLCHPLSIFLENLILLNSIRWRYRKSGTHWKGRSYS
ncbi:glycosyltransferase [Tengunoibacter tsumagoiensis]|uniref:Glycosyl hydrolase n=1 Tax=Tengunoibacter tsumagoiensis TaxID=2014871 RepID=A0A402A4G7_9CHLR|nr:glycosyltransferase family 2 protein [Tengunoibacter tsumagoiensis]GCE14010.1 glycosyl hydrolase [Tengunoibacter tsumagoiensis]